MGVVYYIRYLLLQIRLNSTFGLHVTVLEIINHRFYSVNKIDGIGILFKPCFVAADLRLTLLLIAYIRERPIAGGYEIIVCHFVRIWWEISTLVMIDTLKVICKENLTRSQFRTQLIIALNLGYITM